MSDNPWQTAFCNGASAWRTTIEDPDYRTPTPNDDYLVLLGRAAYTWLYTEWDLIYMLHWATGRELGLAATGGQLVNEFRELLDNVLPVAPDAVDAAREGAEELVRLNHRRNDFLHAHPATIDQHQRLHRYAPDHPQATLGAIEPDDLIAFVLQVEAARSLTDALFEELRAANS